MWGKSWVTARPEKEAGLSMAWGSPPPSSAHSCTQGHTLFWFPQDRRLPSASGAPSAMKGEGRQQLWFTASQAQGVPRHPMCVPGRKRDPLPHSPSLRHSPNTSIVLTAAAAKEGGPLAVVPVSEGEGRSHRPELRSGADKQSTRLWWLRGHQGLQQIGESPSGAEKWPLL